MIEMDIWSMQEWAKVQNDVEEVGDTDVVGTRHENVQDASFFRT